MANSKNDKKSLADPGASHVELRFYPYAKDTQAVVVVAHGLGARAQRLRVWSGVLPIGRSDLHGRNAGEVTFMLAGLLRNALTDSTGDPLAWRTDSRSGEAVGVPLGTTGGTVIHDQLPLYEEGV
jgi:hypothetical protein